MTAATFVSRTDLGRSRVTQFGVLRSEWIKFRSLRSSWYSLLALLVIVDGLGVLFSALHAHREGSIGPGGAKLEGFDPIEHSMRGVFLAQLAIGVLGVLIITGEYGTGQIRSSLSAVPRRYPVLLAKVAVFAAASFTVSFVATFFGFLLGQQAQKSTHAQANLSTPGAWQAILGSAVYLTLIGLLAVGLGFLIRSTAGAIASLVGVVLVAPLLAQALPTPYSTDVTKYLPLSAESRMIMTVHPDANLLGPWVGIGVTSAYVVVALAAGLIALQRRDA